MTATVPVNGHVLRQRLLELGVSDRGFAARSGLGDATLRGMLLRNEINGSISVADLRHAINEAGMTFSDFLDMPAGTNPTTPLPTTSPSSPKFSTPTSAGTLKNGSRSHWAGTLTASTPPPRNSTHG
jgi:hypothetical protein